MTHGAQPSYSESWKRVKPCSLRNYHARLPSLRYREGKHDSPLSRHRERLPMTTVASVADRSLETFYERLRAVNPFLDNRVNGPAPAACDAEAVHPHAFTRLTDLAGQALAARRGLGAVVWGEAGIGKSHLLARLGRWAATNHHAVFVYLHNLQATPEHLPRALLRHVIGVLT